MRYLSSLATWDYEWIIFLVVSWEFVSLLDGQNNNNNNNNKSNNNNKDNNNNNRNDDAGVRAVCWRSK